MLSKKLTTIGHLVGALAKDLRNPAGHMAHKLGLSRADYLLLLESQALELTLPQAQALEKMASLPGMRHGLTAQDWLQLQAQYQRDAKELQ